MIVLDTNVVSELMRASPEPVVIEWLERHDATTLRTTSVTVAEIHYGIARLGDAGRRLALARAADAVFQTFPDQVLAFDRVAAETYGPLVAEQERRGQSINGFDAQIAAICRVHAAELATRNGRHFVGTGVDIVDPWVPT